MRQLKAGASSFFAAVIMGIVVWMFMHFVPDGSHQLLHVIASILLGGLIYPVALYFFMPRLGRSILKAVRSLVTGKPREAFQTVRGALAEQGL
jgi:hypothetical protein